MVMVKKSWYPTYDVLMHKEDWDPHTREIVVKRLGPFAPPQFFTSRESALLASVAEAITGDERAEVEEYVVHEIDATLPASLGEGQRKVGVPGARDLYRNGLAALDKLAKGRFRKGFRELASPQRAELLGLLERGQVDPLPDWEYIPQQELFRKLLDDIVSAYYSHPAVWSEIGYGGPAYPRGYVRVEYGLTDPWEPRRPPQDEGGAEGVKEAARQGDAKP